MLSWITWLNELPISVWLREMPYLFPIIETIHILALGRIIRGSRNLIPVKRLPMRFLHRWPSTIAILCLACAPAFADDVKVDNNFVRIAELEAPPDALLEIAAQTTDRLLISVGAGNVSVDLNGHSQLQSWIAGQTLWVPADQALALKNAGSIPLRLIEVELKAGASGEHQLLNAKLDPIAIDPEHNILVLDNNKIRVFRSWREPGATEKMHEHAGVGRVAVLMSGLDATIKVADGSVTALHAAQGDVLWSGPVIHATTNLGSENFEMVIVEVK